MNELPSRLSIAEYKAQAAQPAKRQPKYRNKRTEVDGWMFDSKLEAGRYLELKDLRRAGAIAWFLSQVPFRLPGGIIYRADFLVVWHDPMQRVTIEDCKGCRTRVSLNKIKTVEEIYGITVQIIDRATKLHTRSRR
jgi:hypothetical protein